MRRLRLLKNEKMLEDVRITEIKLGKVETLDGIKRSFSPPASTKL
jgi:hypothetical protein